MKSENILLTICLIVIFIVILGLCLQSCRSSKVEKHTTMEIDIARNEEKKKKILADSILWESLKANFRFGWTEEFYTPVMDSTGAVTGSVLKQRNTGTVSREEESEKMIAGRQETEEEEKSSASEKTQLADDTIKEKETVFSIPWQMYVMLVIVVFGLCLWQKVKPK